MMQINWAGMYAMCEFCVTQMRAANYRQPDTIVAVARGGLVPATVLAHALGVGDVRSVLVSTYDASKEEGPVRRPQIENSDRIWLSTLSTDIVHGRRKVLIVDDVVDSGATMRYLLEWLPGASTCVLALKGDPSLATFYSCQYPADEWIQFPWEAG